ncbi:MAG: 4Fe-4S binding protein, partial [Oscillospiraceae bacterium]
MLKTKRAVPDNHATIDYTKCDGCGICAAACPRKCITVLA